MDESSILSTLQVIRDLSLSTGTFDSISLSYSLNPVTEYNGDLPVVAEGQVLVAAASTGAECKWRFCCNLAHARLSNEALKQAFTAEKSCQLRSSAPTEGELLCDKDGMFSSFFFLPSHTSPSLRNSGLLRWGPKGTAPPSVLISH